MRDRATSWEALVSQRPSRTSPSRVKVLVKDRRVGTNLPSGGQLGELLPGNASNLVLTTKQHRRMIDELDAELVLEALHLTHQRVNGTSRRTDRGLVDRHEQKSVVADIPARHEGPVVSTPLRQERVDLRQQAFLFLGGQCSLGGEDPDPRVLW